MHARSALPFDPQLAHLDDLHQRVVDVGGLIDPGQLPQRAQPPDVTDQAHVQQAVADRGVGADLHAAAVVRAVGEGHEQEPAFNWRVPASVASRRLSARFL